MNVVTLLPDGVGVRNFLIGPFAREISETDDLLALHTIPDDLLPVYQTGLNGRVGWERLVSYREGGLAAIARYALSYAQMFWGNSEAMRFSLRLAGRGSWRTRRLHQAARLIGRASATPFGIRQLASAHTKIVGRGATVRHYVDLFSRVRPDVVFCSHQRPPIVIPAIVAAQQLGIPTATFIFSWDNLSGKGRIAAPFDHYLVWSAHMRDEFHRYYPDVAADRIHIVGTPQFDFYTDPALQWSREKFFATVGADPARPLICYSGGDVGNSPEDAAHVRILLEHIRAGRIRRSAQVLLRPAPVDNGRRFDEVRRDYPELLFAQPEWVFGGRHNWDQIIPMPADAAFLTNLTRHADVNVNLGSTMTLDFAIHDKPVVNVAFDVADPPPFGLPLWDHHYRFDHYQPVIALRAARFARSAQDLADHVEAYLDNPALDRDGRRQLVELQLGCSPGSSTRRVIDVVRRLGSAERAATGPIGAAQSNLA